MKKTIILLLTIFLLSGCSAYKDLNKLNIIQDMAIIKSKNTFIIILKEVTKKNNEDVSAYEYQYYTKSGKNIKTILKRLNADNNNALYLKKLQTLIINDTSILKNIQFLKINTNFKVYYAYHNINKIMYLNKDFNYLHSLTSTNKNTYSYIMQKKKINSYILSYQNKKLIKKRVFVTLN